DLTHMSVQALFCSLFYEQISHLCFPIPILTPPILPGRERPVWEATARNGAAMVRASALRHANRPGGRNKECAFSALFTKGQGIRQPYRVLSQVFASFGMGSISRWSPGW